MKIISRNDYRILELFRDFLIRHKDLPYIDVFVSKLESYGTAVGKIDSEAGEKIDRYWWDIEQIYAWYLSEEHLEPNESEREKMLKIHNELLDYSTEILKKYTP